MTTQLRRATAAALLLAIGATAEAENVLHRTSKAYIISANTPDYPVQDWIHSPNVSCCYPAWATKYWTITGDVVTLMSQAERDAVDAAELEVARDAEENRLGNVEAIERAVLLVLLDEVNLIRANLPHPITSITRSGNTATVTTAVAHGLATNDSVTVFGADQSAYNKFTTVTVTNSTTFTYGGVTGSPASPATGSIVWIEGAPEETGPRTIQQLRTAVRNKLGQ